MSRRSRTTRDSLDLLLDTVCNAFGGIVFISILIVVLLNVTSVQHRITPPSSEAQAELLRLQSTARTRQQQLTVLREAERQLSSVEEQFIDSDAHELVVRLEELKSDSHDLESDLADARSAIATGQAQINRIAQALAVLERELKQARSDLADIQRVLAAEIATRSRTSKLPRQRTTQKRLVAFLLKGGRLCSFYRVGRDGRLVQNDVECQIRDHANGSQSVAPRAAAGLKVEPRVGQQAAISQRFSQFDRERHFVAVVVWPDSFAHFEVVKRIIVARKFEYQLAPWLDDEPLFIGRSMGPQRVQ